ncbi:CHC2 zinc finger domain-containing protein [Niallia oryzisoli]|uniref:CHC2 zinc finger domain-containing protein n=1 Tax=Niallia oryzisoli TaxID=1737571 RepID=UPI00373629CC
MQTTILPNILGVAEQYNLEADRKTIGKKETRFKCPFCHADANKSRKYFLSINEGKNVFKCWSCQESGGVLRLISFLENKSEQEVIEQLRESNGFNYQKHPAERLTRSQLKMIGYEKIDWIKNREYDVEMYKHFRNYVYQKWLNFVEYKQDFAYQQLYIGLLSGKFQQTVKQIEKDEKELNISLLDKAIKKLSSAERCVEELEGEEFIASVCNRKHPFYENIDNLIAALELKTKKERI